MPVEKHPKGEAMRLLPNFTLSSGGSLLPQELGLMGARFVGKVRPVLGLGWEVVHGGGQPRWALLGPPAWNPVQAIVVWWGLDRLRPAVQDLT